MISKIFRFFLASLILLTSIFAHAASAPWPRELNKLSSLGELGQRVGRLVVSQQDPLLSSVMLSALRHPRVRIISLRELKHDWTDQFLAIAVVENRPFSRVHIQQVGPQQNFNDEITRNFLAKEQLNEGQFWLVLPKTSNRRNVMTVAHELAHVYVQKFLDERAPILVRRYPELFIGTRGERFIMDSDVYSYITELFARFLEYAYFSQISANVANPDQEFVDAPYLKRGDSFAQFRWKATLYLIREYEIPSTKARRWMDSPLFQDMIKHALTTGSL
ncbi:MAG: hypothetical protein ACK5V3_05195 [Bdellovibrionales bacterium]